jgi:hypothetical protein
MPKRTSRRSSQHRNRYRKDQSIRAVGLQAGLPANGLIRAPIEFLYPTGPGHVAQALLAPAECIEVRPHSRAFTFGAQAEITPT